MPDAAPKASKSRSVSDNVVIELTCDEFDSLLIMMGYAAGAASSCDSQLLTSFLRLANAVNRNNPRWTPYAMPDEPTP
jgi:hypothetical protein